jgi:hypothetical protein
MSSSGSWSLVQIEPKDLITPMSDIAAIIKERTESIVKARQQKGGWEGWLQVEMGLALPLRLGLQYDFLREQQIFAAPNNAQRVDLWLTPAPGQTKRPILGIELKVESEYQTGANKTLYDRFSADIAKCNAGPRSDLKAGNGTHMVAIGITSLEKDLANYSDLVKKTGQRICLVRLVEDRDHPERSIYLLWWDKLFKA